MGITTGKGDDGTTELHGGERVSKNHPRIALLGDLDELSSHLGAARSFCHGPATGDPLAFLQRDLHLLAAVVSGAEKPAGFATRTERLEAKTEEIERELPPLNHFILPGGPPCAAMLHVARAVCRRAERSMAVLGEEMSEPRIWLNRLSDFLFLAARREILATGNEEESV